MTSVPRAEPLHAGIHVLVELPYHLVTFPPPGNLPHYPLVSLRPSLPVGGRQHLLLRCGHDGSTHVRTLLPPEMRPYLAGIAYPESLLLKDLPPCVQSGVDPLRYVLNLNLRRQRQGKQQRLARYALILNLAPVLALYQLYPLLAGLRYRLEQVVHVSAQSGQLGNINDIALHAPPDQSSELPVIRLRPSAYMLLRNLYRVRVNSLALEVLPHAVLLLEELLLVRRTSVINLLHNLFFD